VRGARESRPFDLTGRKSERLFFFECRSQRDRTGLRDDLEGRRGCDPCSALTLPAERVLLLAPDPEGRVLG